MVPVHPVKVKVTCNGQTPLVELHRVVDEMSDNFHLSADLAFPSKKKAIQKNESFHKTA